MKRSIKVSLFLVGALALASFILFSYLAQFGPTTRTSIIRRGHLIEYFGGPEFVEREKQLGLKLATAKSMVPGTAQTNWPVMVDGLFFFPSYLPSSSSIYLSGWLIEKSGIPRHVDYGFSVPLAECTLRDRY